MNVWEEKDSDVLKSNEIKDLISILNVDLYSKDKPAYDEIAIMTDADVDGSNISMLLIAFFYKYWPHWFDAGRIKIVRTPEYISTNGKKTVWSYDKTEFDSHKFGSGWDHRHIKGLGSVTTEGEEGVKIVNMLSVFVNRFSKQLLLMIKRAKCLICCSRKIQQNVKNG